MRVKKRKTKKQEATTTRPIYIGWRERSRTPAGRTTGSCSHSWRGWRRSCQAAWVSRRERTRPQSESCSWTVFAHGRCSWARTCAWLDRSAADDSSVCRWSCRRPSSCCSSPTPTTTTMTTKRTTRPTTAQKKRTRSVTVASRGARLPRSCAARPDSTCTPHWVCYSRCSWSWCRARTGETSSSTCSTLCARNCCCCCCCFCSAVAAVAAAAAASCWATWSRRTESRRRRRAWPRSLVDCRRRRCCFADDSACDEWPSAPRWSHSRCWAWWRDAERGWAADRRCFVAPMRCAQAAAAAEAEMASSRAAARWTSRPRRRRHVGKRAAGRCCSRSRGRRDSRWRGPCVCKGSCSWRCDRAAACSVWSRAWHCWRRSRRCWLDWSEVRKSRAYSRPCCMCCCCWRWCWEPFVPAAAAADGGVVVAAAAAAVAAGRSRCRSWRP